MLPSPCKGFTLIELMVAMVLSLFLLGGVILMYASTKSTYEDVDRLSRLQENVRFASDYLVRDVRNAGFRDEMTLTIGNADEISDPMAVVSDDGTELTIRYAGRGHCSDPFSETSDTRRYYAVENRYYVDANTDELMCEGAYVDEDGTRTDVDSQALIAGVTGLNFRLIKGDGAVVGDDVCRELDIVPPDDRCIGVIIGMTFEGLRGSSGDLEERFVELVATFRNSAMDRIFATTGS
ncbi:PilW family protein [Wenzhouxiangella sp. EGI_FJ10305]|uniref:PilW family protein n=1 Tax=Wenzhouxiangella sp. EGI_FJ10305 TaxID=3243768 RepID=UPI0035E08C9B